MRKVLLTAAIAVMGVLAAAGLANAATLTATGGNITATSSGRITFASGLGLDVACSMTWTGSFATSAIGALPLPIGVVSGGSATSCSNGSISLLPSQGNPWDIRVSAVGAPSSLSIARVTLLVTVGRISACLYTLTVNASHVDGVFSDTVTLTGTTTTASVLLGGVCARAPSLVGTLSMSTSQTFGLTP